MATECCKRSFSVQLRPQGREQVKTYWEKVRNEKTLAHFPIKLTSLDEALARFEASQRADADSFGLCIYADEQYIGDVWCYGIDLTEEKMAMLSICIFEPDFWGKGIGSKAICEFSRRAFSRYPIDKLGAFTFTDNLASLKMLRKSGFQEIERFWEEGKESIYLELCRKEIPVFSTAEQTLNEGKES